MRASSRPIFPRRQLPWTRGLLLIFSVLLLSAPQSCTPFQTWKLVPPFFGEKAATPNEGWHSSSLLLILLLPPPAAPTPPPPPPAAAFVPQRPPAKSFRLLPNSTTEPFSFQIIFHIIWQIFIKRVSLVQVAGKNLSYKT